MKLPFLGILFFSMSVFGQTMLCKELKYKSDSKFYTTSKGDSTIVYPVIITKNPAVNKLINDKIRTTLFAPAGKKIRPDKEIRQAIGEGLINMSYEISFKKDGLLSINIYREGCGAYCSSWLTWFNFDLKTGKPVTITGIIENNRLDSFRAAVMQDKKTALEQYKIEEQKLLTAKEIDSASYEIIMEQVNKCEESSEINNFSLSEGFLTIIDPCEFPHFIRSQEPVYELKYPYKNWLAFLSVAYRRRLSK